MNCQEYQLNFGGQQPKPQSLTLHKSMQSSAAVQQQQYHDCRRPNRYNVQSAVVTAANINNISIKNIFITIVANVVPIMLTTVCHRHGPIRGGISGQREDFPRLTFGPSYIYTINYRAVMY